MKKMKSYFTAIILLAFVGYWRWILISRGIENHLLDNYSKEIKAVVFNKRNYMANSPVSHEYSYSYKFEIRGVFYDGDSKNSKLKLGDTIVVKYVADRPEINEPVE